ncbi:hypothetical protein ACLBKU_07175 [Erythrobacter sp. NE805]|uniref:hypothetical protein n=1 Tax=Erythrobacter sp. NE805 TaxID=3389875 RepID=UPI00396AF10F
MVGAQQSRIFFRPQHSAGNGNHESSLDYASDGRGTAALRRDVAMSAHDEYRDTLLLIESAEQELKRRRLRMRFLPAELFGEGAWAMLLDLFICEHRGKLVSTTSLCLASDVPPTTALRWLDVLECKGLIRRTGTVKDRRVKHVSLTQEGHVALRAILTSFGGR